MANDEPARRHAAAGQRHNGLPLPTLFFITPDNVIAARLGDENCRVRPAPQLALETIDSLGR